MIGCLVKKVYRMWSPFPVVCKILQTFQKYTSLRPQKAFHQAFQVFVSLSYGSRIDTPGISEYNPNATYKMQHSLAMPSFYKIIWLDMCMGKLSRNLCNCRMLLNVVQDTSIFFMISSVSWSQIRLQPLSVM